MTPAPVPARLPADHPSIPPKKTGILIANLGTPDGYDYWSMRRYLNEFLSDKRVIDYPAWKWQPLLQGIILTKRPFTSGRNYKLIWNEERNESPLMTITRSQAEALRARTTAEWGDQVMVDFCMRYGNPSTEDVLDRMVKAGCQRIVFLPLYPQYAGATSATANDQLFRALMTQKWQPSVRTCEPYFDRPDYIQALAASVRRALGDKVPAKLVASYHGMPRRYLLEGDPYHCQCQKTSRLLKEALGWPDGVIDTTFQSVFGTEEWLRPYTVEHVAELAKQGITDIAVISPAFAADCIETLEEINGEIRESFEHAGGKGFTYIPCLNDDPAHVEVMLAVVRDNIAGWV
ncbi:ferrochelatase [Paracoccus sp. SSK6]|uniref:ferrochelatase n=1 Tax=Paracoccus sp. SSK6 TaxID=3143131 RepID=UPI00321A0A5E